MPIMVNEDWLKERKLYMFKKNPQNSIFKYAWGNQVNEKLDLFWFTPESRCSSWNSWIYRPPSPSSNEPQAICFCFCFVSFTGV